jgi:SPP1 gp7 family putative phage head morphogenesis protein
MVIGWTRELRSQIKTPKSRFDISLPGPALTKIYWQSMLIAYFHGYKSHMDEARAKTEKKFLKLQFPDNFAYWNAGYDEALKFFKSKPIIPPKVFKDSEALVKKIFWSVQRTEKYYALRHIKRALDTTIKKGLSLADFNEFLPEIFETSGMTPLEPWHIEVVYRTNLQSVYNAGRFDAAMADPATESLEYISIDDNRRTAICEALDGRIYKKDDPIWETIMPPNHYQCRSQTAPVMAFENRKTAGPINPFTRALVHPDFRESPLTLTSFQKKIRVLAKLRREQFFGMF